MDFKVFAGSIKDIIADPERKWSGIRSERRPAGYLAINILLPLVVLVSLSAFLGSFLFVNTGLLKVYSVLSGIKYFLLMFLVIFGTAFVHSLTSEKLGSEPSFTVSFTLILYSSIPFILCQIISRLFESFIFINILALYGLFIFWTGTGIITETTKRNRLILLITITASLFFIYFSGEWLLTKLIDKIYFSIIA